MSLWSAWLVLPTLIILVGLPSIFSTPNDKNNVVIPTPGPARVLIELLQYAVAAVAPWMVWPPLVAGIAVTIVAASLVTGISRMLWLIRGAQATDRTKGSSV